jgi:hypothetical protein
MTKVCFSFAGTEGRFLLISKLSGLLALPMSAGQCIDRIPLFCGENKQPFICKLVSCSGTWGR